MLVGLTISVTISGCGAHYVCTYVDTIRWGYDNGLILCVPTHGHSKIPCILIGSYYYNQITITNAQSNQIEDRVFTCLTLLRG